MKNKHIKKVKQLGAGGLGLFLITGLTGCDGGVNNKCKDMSILTLRQLEECRSHHGFIPINTYAGAGAGASTRKSGFFSSSEGHSSTSSSHTSSSSGG